MRKKIIIILGEPNSISSEIFFKSLNYLKKINLNFIIIGNYSLLKKQANYLNFKINENFNICKLDNVKNKKFNFIDIYYNQKKAFDLKETKSNTIIKKSFECAISLLKKKNSFRTN